MIKSFLKNNYNLDVYDIRQMAIGTGGYSYKIITKSNVYVLKLTKEDSMNHPLIEPIICEVLNNNGVNTLKFIKSINDEFSTKFNDYVANVYEYVEGDTVSHNSLDESLVNECVTILAKINIILKDFKLSDGISKEFFKFMKPENALKSYLKSLEKAKLSNNEEISNYINIRIELLEYIKNWSFNIDYLTCCNSHGDFTNNQLIINDKINIIDFTVCCKQPVIWELTRFFFHADKSAKDGNLNQNRFYEYLSYYCKNIVLNEYDLDNIFKLYFYQILVCDYYSEYFNEDDEVKKQDYLIQANFASKILAANKDLIKSFK